MPAEPSTSWLPIGLYATLPFWPLLGAILVGILVAVRVRPTLAHWPVVLGTALSAVLGITLFFDLGRSSGPGSAGSAPGRGRKRQDGGSNGGAAGSGG